MSTATRVLVVEDDPHAMILLQLIFDWAPDLSCTYLSDPREALERLASPGWDVLVTDMQMPGLDGLALATAARRTDPLLPVVLMTAHPSLEAAVLAVRGAVTDFLTKPLNAAEVLASVEQAASRRRASQRRIPATEARYAARGRRHRQELEDTLVPAHEPTVDLLESTVRGAGPDVV